MTPDDALIHLAREGWDWSIDAKHSSRRAHVCYVVAGWAPWAAGSGNISVYVPYTADLAAAVAYAKAEAARLTAEHAYDPYSVAA
jgi:hypothetical protein